MAEDARPSQLISVFGGPRKPHMLERMTMLRRLVYVLAALVATAALSCRSDPPGWASLAAGDMRSICAALEGYRAECGAYPDVLARLAPPGGVTQRSCERLGVVSDRRIVEGILLVGQPSTDGRYAWSYDPSGPTTSKFTAGFAHYELRATWIGREGKRPSFWVSDAGRMTIASGRAASPIDQVME